MGLDLGVVCVFYLREWGGEERGGGVCNTVRLSTVSVSPSGYIPYGTVHYRTLCSTVRVPAAL